MDAGDPETEKGRKEEKAVGHRNDRTPKASHLLDGRHVVFHRRRRVKARVQKGSARAKVAKGGITEVLQPPGENAAKLLDEDAGLADAAVPEVDEEPLAHELDHARYVAAFAGAEDHAWTCDQKPMIGRFRLPYLMDLFGGQF